jgi:hypothetical protein
MDNPDGILCGQTMTFTVRVRYLGEVPVTGGTVSIIDYDTQEVLGSAANETGTVDIVVQKIPGVNLINGVVGEDGDAWIFGDRNVYAYFSGIPDAYYKGSSAKQKCYVSKAITQIVSSESNLPTQSAAVDGYYLFLVSQTGGSFDYVDGYCDFHLYSDNETYVSLARFSVTFHGHATARIPAYTMIAGKKYYLTAFFRGNGCVDPSATGVGLEGFEITAT